MNKTIQSFLILVTTITLTGCGSHKSNVSDFTGDPALRMMLGIRSLTGSMILPPSEDYYEISIFNFEDGKLIKRESPLFGSLEQGKQDRQLKPQLLWGTVGGKMLVSLTLDGSGGPWEDAFWNRLDSGWRSIANTTHPETTQEGGSSSALAAPKQLAMQNSRVDSTLTFALNLRRVNM